MIQTFLGRVRRQEPGVYQRLYWLAKSIHGFRAPAVRPLGAVLLHGRDIWKAAWSIFKSRFIYEQMLRYRCSVTGRVRLDGDMPLVYGDGAVVIEDGVTIGNRNTWIVGLKVYPEAKLEIGEGSALGYLNLISVAQHVRIGRHCLFAGEIKIIDNNSHSLDAARRRANAPLLPADVAPIVIEDDVWIGTNCIILKGVTIGRGAVIAAGAVVTKSVPPFTVAAGNPARVIKQIERAGSVAGTGSGAIADVHVNHR
jgi:acetyltransferase-like isoleucine patch superfamily enzyme